MTESYRKFEQLSNEGALTEKSRLKWNQKEVIGQRTVIR
jgi:hypothetical protein